MMVYLEGTVQRWDKLKPKCKGCIYLGSAIPCQYILITGHSPQSQGAHIDPEGPGGCELKETKGKRRREVAPPLPSTLKPKEAKKKSSKLDAPEVMELYKAGKSDGEIAKFAGVTSEAVRWWRKRKNLPSNIQRTRGSKVDTPEVMALYKAGKTDKEIAKFAGVTTVVVCRWRKRKNLPVNARESLCGRLDTPEVMALYEAGKSDSEIAKFVGVKTSMVFYWRTQRGLPTKWNSKKTTDARRGEGEREGA